MPVVNKTYAGAPIELSDNWYRATVSSAFQAVHEEELHTRKGFQRCRQAYWPAYTGDIWVNPIVFTADGDSPVGDPLEICSMLPALKHLPEDMLRQLSRAKIFQLN
jgi:hypothetical protein